MSLKNLREEVLQANLELVRRGLVLYTFGNASGISREQGVVVIKPSGVPYETMKPGGSRGRGSARQYCGGNPPAVLQFAHPPGVV